MAITIGTIKICIPSFLTRTTTYIYLTLHWCCPLLVVRPYFVNGVIRCALIARIVLFLRELNIMSSIGQKGHSKCREVP